MNVFHGASVAEIVAASLFVLALAHTFCAGYVNAIARRGGAHSGAWHLLGEVEAAIGIWAFFFLFALVVMNGLRSTTEYLDERRFVEPIFVFVVMIMASSRPVLQVASGSTEILSRAIPLPRPMALYFLSLSLLPLLGSIVTEPAAMALAALTLRAVVFSRSVSNRLKYATLGVLFVNLSIGGALTHFAAPPILMVAAKWEWGLLDVFAIIGWKAAIAVLINAIVITALFARELRGIQIAPIREEARVPWPLAMASLVLLAGVVYFNHDPEMFVALFLVFLGLFEAYKSSFGNLMFRGALMVALFLAGLVILGGAQKWWLQPLLSNMSHSVLFYGATALTAVTDNAAITYLGSLVDESSNEFKYAIVSGAIAGGGLTVIANAPNPAGYAILKDTFEGHVINPLWLFVAALFPTSVAMACFRILGDLPAFFGIEACIAWIESADRGFLFLAILPFVVAAVAIWNLRREERQRLGR